MRKTGLKHTTGSHADFATLVNLLNQELAARDGADHIFYAPLNSIDGIDHAVVLYEEGRPVACGALRRFSDDAMEIKRMFTLPVVRGRGYARRALQALEERAAGLGCERCVLETGKRQPEAIALYRSAGYRSIPNFGPYEGIENSLCFEKKLKPSG